MSLIEFRDRFEDQLHSLLWRQWSQLGVAGVDAGLDRWILDPEALLLVSLESARTEPRLFDEILDWLLTNGERLDVQRLSNLKDEDEDFPKALLNAVASLMAEHETSAKWSRMASFVPDPAAIKIPLIHLRPGVSMPSFRSLDRHFEQAGLLRSPYEARGLSTSIPMQSGPCVRFRLRAFFGIGIRSEAVIYLLTHPESHADNVARAIGYSFPGVQQVLREMNESGLLHVRRAGREKRYWVDKEKWSEFLDLNFVDPQHLAARREAGKSLTASGTGEGTPEKRALDLEARKREAERIPDEKTELEARRRSTQRPLRPEVAWVNWSRLYRGLARILRHLRLPGWEARTEYVRSSEFARTVALAKDDLEAAERGFHLPSQEGDSLDSHVLALQHALGWLLQ